MNKKIISVITAILSVFSLSGCAKNNTSSESVPESSISSSESTDEVSEVSEEPSTEPETEEPTEPLAPTHTETVTSELGSQVTLSKTIQREDGSNTIKIPLSSLIEDGDVVKSFTFIIYSDDGSNIGTFKGGCGISVNDGCPSSEDNWYQSDDFSAATEGTYGEITWEVPSDIRDYINADGEVLFGYWWGNSTAIRIEQVVCTYTRTKEVDVLDTSTVNVNKSVGYNDSDNTIRVPISDIVPESNQVPVSVTFNISSSGSLGKFTGAFGVSSDVDSTGWYQSDDVAVFTDGSSISLTWIIPEDVRKKINSDGDIMLGYWWSEQSEISLDSVSVKYTWGNTATTSAKKESTETETEPVSSVSENGFRSADEIVSDIKVGWNLGNTLECYDYKSWTDNAETSWGNPRTTKEMIESVKAAGFNAIRIPVTWGEHMDSNNNIDSEWMSRVKEVVDYAYDNGMYVILNMHHDDYIWFTPSESEYTADSEKLCSIWNQIAEHFKDYGDRLLFEGMNEPRTVGSDKEWTGGTAEERAVINKYEQDFVDTVRATGGNNADRTLVITSYAASIDTDAVNDIVVPDDKNIIVSIHYYSPWDFANGDSTEWGTDSDKTELDAGFSMLKSKFVDKGVPVIIGEFGSTAASSDDVRAEYYEYYIESAARCGIKCFVWDNGVTSGDSSFGLLNRKTLTWNTDIVDGIMKGTED
jgi:aryl-phospho-beta-D-glucosidase BglC (GH1 family)